MDIFEILRVHKADLERERLRDEAPIMTVEPTVKERTKISEFTVDELREMSDEDFLKLEQDI